MRTAVAIGSLLVCLSVGMAAGGAARPVNGSASLTANALKVVRAGLAPEVRLSLAGPVTRDEQLRVLRSNAQTSAYLQKLAVGSTPSSAGSDPWLTGVTVTPLSGAYPAGASAASAQLRLESQAMLLMAPDIPLPNPTQNPPLLYFMVPWKSERCLFTLRVRWPQPGGYMVTFSMRNIGISDAKPRIFGRNKGNLLTVIPNKQMCADRWTVLCDGTDPQAQSEALDVYPSEDGVNFCGCCLSKVTVNRVQ